MDDNLNTLLEKVNSESSPSRLYFILDSIAKLFVYYQPSEEVRQAITAYKCSWEKEQIYTPTVARASSRFEENNQNNLVVDANKLYAQIYDECKNCSLSNICKQSPMLISEYIGKAIIELS